MDMFELENSVDKFKVLVKQYGHYQNKKTSSNRAISFFDTAWSLTEWVGKEFGNVLNKKDLGAFRETLYPRCPHLKIIHDISNKSKHMTLSNPKSNILKAGRQNGPFSTVFTAPFQSTSLIIELENGAIYKVENMIDEVLDFWNYYFQYDLKMPKERLSITLEDYTNP